MSELEEEMEKIRNQTIYSKALEYIDMEGIYTIGYGGDMSGFAYEDTVIEALKIADTIMKKPSKDICEAMECACTYDIYDGSYGEDKQSGDDKFKELRDIIIKECK